MAPRTAPDDATGRPLRATIVNCYPDHNKGSAALVAGLIARLRRSDVVGAITIVTLFEHVEVETDFRHLVRAYPDVTIVPSPLMDPAPGTGSLRKAAETAYITARTMGVRAEVRRRSRGRNAAAAVIADSDLVLERGGPFFKGMGPPPNPSLLRYAWPLHLARAAGVPYAMVGESFGPLTNSWARRVVRRLVVGSGLTSTREDISRDVLSSAGVPVGSVSTMLDNAFWTEPNCTPAVRQLMDQHALVPGRFVAVTARERRTSREQDEYLTELARAIDELVSSTFDAAAIVPNLFDPAGPEHDDRRVGRELLDRVRRKDAVRLVEADLAPGELAALYGEAALVIGHRLHSLILGTVGGTPVVGIASSVGPKTVGALQLLGLDDFVVPIQDLASDTVVAKAKAALHSQTGVPDRVRTLRQRSDEELDRFLDAVARHRTR